MELNSPQITDVDALLVNVSQAFTTRKHALIVTLKPGPVAFKTCQLCVRGLVRTPHTQWSRMEWWWG